MVFYRVYRPQTFSEVVGQTTIIEALTTVVKNGSPAHAYLFAGPRGCGKTTTARILAKALNCENDDRLSLPVNREMVQTTNNEQRTTIIASADPCNTCSSCLAITSGRHMDVIEIDAASNRGIDDIRAFQEKIYLAPTQGKKKVYIIDEVHMLTTEAFNALLKTLEEPPDHVVIVLATTDPKKVPQTILSRSVRFSFALANEVELTKALKRIIDKEHLQIEDDALALLIRRAEGGYRDGVKLLDQIASLGKPITKSLIESYFDTPQDELTLRFLQSLAQGNTTACLQYVDDFVSTGGNAYEFVTTLLRQLRAALLGQNGVGESNANIANLFNRKQLVTLLKLFSLAEREMKVMSIQSLPLELAIIDYSTQSGESVPDMPQKRVEVQVSEPNKPVGVSKPLDALKDKKVEDILEVSSTIGQSENEPPTQIIAPEELGAMLADESDNIVVEMPEPVAAEAVISETLENKTPIGQVSTGDLKAKWHDFITIANEQNHGVALLVKNATIEDLTEDTVTLGVVYKFHKERLENDKNRRLLEDTLFSVFGTRLRLRCVLADVPKKPAAIEEIFDNAEEIFGIEAAD